MVEKILKSVIDNIYIMTPGLVSLNAVRSSHVDWEVHAHFGNNKSNKKTQLLQYTEKVLLNTRKYRTKLNIINDYIVLSVDTSPTQTIKGLQN